MACLMKGAVKKLKQNHCASSSNILSKTVAVDYTAVLFIYTFCFAEHNLINWTGTLSTVDSHSCNHTKFSNDMYRLVPNCCKYSCIS